MFVTISAAPGSVEFNSEMEQPVHDMPCSQSTFASPVESFCRPSPNTTE